MSPSPTMPLPPGGMDGSLGLPPPAHHPLSASLPIPPRYGPQARSSPAGTTPARPSPSPAEVIYRTAPLAIPSRANTTRFRFCHVDCGYLLHISVWICMFHECFFFDQYVL